MLVRKFIPKNCGKSLLGLAWHVCVACGKKSGFRAGLERLYVYINFHGDGHIEIFPHIIDVTNWTIRVKKKSVSKKMVWIIWTISIVSQFRWWKMFDEPFELPSLVKRGIVKPNYRHAHFSQLKEGQRNCNWKMILL